MVDVGAAIRKFLIAKTSVKALIEDRMFPEALDQAVALPAVTYRKLGGRLEHALSGISGLAAQRITIECTAFYREQADAVADAMILSDIDKIKGLTHGLDIRGVRIEDEKRTWEEPPTDGSTNRRYVTSFDILVDYLRA